MAAIVLVTLNVSRQRFEQGVYTNLHLSWVMRSGGKTLVIDSHKGKNTQLASATG